MQRWQFLLLLLGGLWALQSLGAWVQFRRYGAAMRAVLRQWSDGFVGTGYARGRFLGRGAIVLLVVGPDDRIRRLMIMEGRSIFPRFVPLAEFEGRDFSTLEKGRVFPAREKARNTALAGAVEQIRRAKAKKMLANSSQGAFETAPT